MTHAWFPDAEGDVQKCRTRQRGQELHPFGGAERIRPVQDRQVGEVRDTGQRDDVGEETAEPQGVDHQGVLGRFGPAVGERIGDFQANGGIVQEEEGGEWSSAAARSQRILWPRESCRTGVSRSRSRSSRPISSSRLEMYSVPGIL